MQIAHVPMSVKMLGTVAKDLDPTDIIRKKEDKTLNQI